jgi:putative ABC transport system ATP-binding protein
MIELRRLTKIHRAGEVETTALNEIDLQIQRGEYVAVTGPSGCGKSTLLAVLGLLDHATTGEYVLDGTRVTGLNERRLSQLRTGRVGFIFQSFNLIEDLTVRENVGLALEYGNLPRQEHGNRIMELLDRLGIGHRAGHRPSQLSGGQQQRVAIARALVTRPPLLLADEPTGNLDSRHGTEVMAILDELNAEGTTIVTVTHSSTHAAMAKRTLHMLDGRFVSPHGQETLNQAVA